MGWRQRPMPPLTTWRRTAASVAAVAEALTFVSAAGGVAAFPATNTTFASRPTLASSQPPATAPDRRFEVAAAAKAAAASGMSSPHPPVRRTAFPSAPQRRWQNTRPPQPWPWPRTAGRLAKRRPAAAMVGRPLRREAWTSHRLSSPTSACPVGRRRRSHRGSRGGGEAAASRSGDHPSRRRRALPRPERRAGRAQTAGRRQSDGAEAVGRPPAAAGAARNRPAEATGWRTARPPGGMTLACGGRPRTSGIPSGGTRGRCGIRGIARLGAGVAGRSGSWKAAEAAERWRGCQRPHQGCRKAAAHPPSAGRTIASPCPHRRA